MTRRNAHNSALDKLTNRLDFVAKNLRSKRRNHSRLLRPIHRTDQPRPRVWQYPRLPERQKNEFGPLASTARPTERRGCRALASQSLEKVPRAIGPSR